MSTIALSTWNVTCSICNAVRNALVVAFVGLIAFGESAGRARAASQLAELGYYKEAEHLMKGK